MAVNLKKWAASNYMRKSEDKSEGKSEGKNMRLLCLGEAPLCSRADMILRGYRPEYNWSDALKSSFAWHNETVNIWSQDRKSVV